MATILVIDDEPTNRQLLNTVLGYQGHAIVEAGDGQEGLEKSRATHPDLAIVDILMPTMDGFEFVRQLRSDASIAATPIIFYTAAYYEREIRSLAQNCGVSSILTKPTDPQIILAAVDAVLGRSGEAAPVPAPEEFDREHLRLMTNKLSQKVAELEAVGLRLAKLIEIGRELASERDSNGLIRMACQSAREIIGAAQAGIGIVDEAGKLLRFEFHGVSVETAANLESPALDEGVVQRVLSERRPVNILNPQGDPRALGLPANHPPVHSFLGVPVGSPARLYGWLGVRNKVGAAEFSLEDEKLAVSLAAQTATAYENLERFAEIQTHAEKLEQEVSERTADLKRSNAELEQFAYVASHDLQEPLRKILGFTDLLAQNLKTQLDGNAKEYMSYVTDAATRMRDLIQDLLAYSRAGRQIRDQQPIDCEAVLNRVLLDLELAIEEQAATVTHSRLPTLMGDATQVAQLFQNLIGNALKYRSNQPPRIRVEAKLINQHQVPSPASPGETSEKSTIINPNYEMDNPQSAIDNPNFPESALRNPHSAIPQSASPDSAIRNPQSAMDSSTVWLFSVHDNGMGIESKYAERIFRVFQRLHTRAQYPGTGIGLAICKKIVEGCGGQIWMESAAGQGSTFYFTMPAAQAAAPTGAA